jgi:hypothetical protein
MDFPTLDRLRRDLKELNALQVDSLAAYYDVNVHGFSHLAPVDGNALTKFSVASSATCVVALTITGNWELFEKRVAKGKGGSGELTAFLDQMLSREPKLLESAKLGEGNPFTVAFSLEAVKVAASELKTRSEDEYTTRVERLNAWIKQASDLLIQNLLSSPTPTEEDPNDWSGRGSAKLSIFRPTTFLTQLVVRALKQTPDTMRPENPQAVDAQEDPTPDVIRWSWRQILQEFALLATGKRGSDPLALAYGLIIFVTCKGIAKLSLEEQRIVARSVDALFAAQLADGSWQQSRPLHFYPLVGNAYCFDFEVLAQLLECQDLKGHLLPYLPQLEKAFRYAQSNATGIGERGKCWSSGHHPHLATAESWSTASVYHFIHNLDRLIAEAIRQHVFEYLGSPYTVPKDSALSVQEGEKNFRAKFYDSNIKLDGATVSLTRTFLDKFLVPLARETKNVAIGKGMPKTTAIAGILYGPPGTSKTQLAKLVAQYLRWPLLSIDPSHLVREGLDLVQAESNHVFGMLAALEQTVVFLDEFDELMRERTSSRADVMSRFLTTAMLPKLTSISDSRRVVFLLATNYLSQFDFAIRRPGRFDMVVQVMPPTWKAKQSNPDWITPSKLIARAIAQAPVEANKPSWDEKLDELTFLEFNSLCNRIENGMTDEEIVRAVVEAWDKATLNQPLQSGGKKKETWRDQSAEDEKLNRFL